MRFLSVSVNPLSLISTIVDRAKVATEEENVNPLSLISTIVDLLFRKHVKKVNPLSLISTIVDTKSEILTAQ